MDSFQILNHARRRRMRRLKRPKKTRTMHNPRLKELESSSQSVIDQETRSMCSHWSKGNRSYRYRYVREYFLGIRDAATRFSRVSNPGRHLARPPCEVRSPHHQSSPLFQRWRSEVFDTPIAVVCPCLGEKQAFFYVVTIDYYRQIAQIEERIRESLGRQID